MRSLLPCLLAAAVAVAACSESPPGGSRPPDGAVTDVSAEASADAPPPPKDAPPMDAPARCTGAMDCRGEAGRGACDTATGRCVQCVATDDTCPATEHCNPMTNTCASGCRSDEGCAMSTGGMPGGDGGAARRGRCDRASHVCVECLGNDDCAPGNRCVGNVCVMGCSADSRCPTGQTCCGGACVDTQANLAHCGRCEGQCTVPNAMAACLNGSCGVGACNAPFADCDTNGANGCETDTRTSTAHCGECGRACAPRANAEVTCGDGRCAFTCTPGFADCNGDAADGCEVDTRTSAAHCGACARACNPANATGACEMGRCAVGRCDDGFGDCDGDAANGCETNLRTSTTHCGRCAEECPARPNSAPTCAAGACVLACATGFADCNGDAMDGCETDTRTSVAHCGACGRMCTAAGGTAACEGSVCRVAGCAAGRGDCDGMVANGCEVDLTSALAHCGACGMTCPARPNASPTCAAGGCGFACAADFGDCDAMVANGCETDTRTSVAHCGACGRACSLPNATPGCAAGACAVAACDSGFGDCDLMAANGCETDTRASVAHCGACGRACTYANAAGVCRGGACAMGACAAGFSDCDYDPANGCETRGACVYPSCNAIPRAAPTGVYTLSAGGTNWSAYCDMASDGGGWTLVMKVPGRDGRFVYTSALWTDASVLNEGSTDLSTTPAKFRGFSALPFTQLRLGMLDGAPRFIVVNVAATPLASLRAVFAGGPRATSAGRAAWLRLPASPSLQRNCNAEGFNLDSAPYGAVRLGILGNQENDCATPDSRVGFGGEHNLCGPGGDVSSGNVASCDPDNGGRDSALFGFIFVR